MDGYGHLDPTTGGRSGSDLYQTVLQDISDTDEFREKARALHKKRLKDRPKRKTKPYVGAPNFVSPVIDDMVRSKTELEINLLWNAPRIAHAVPLGPVDAQTKRDAEEAWNTYFRYIIRGRARLEEGLETKNELGFCVFKKVRRFSKMLRQSVPDFIVCDYLDVVVPADSPSQVEELERLTHILRYSPRQLRIEGAQKGWRNIEELLQLVASSSRETDSQDDSSSTDAGENTFQSVRDMIGLTTGRGAKHVLVYEVYHYATKEDVEWQSQNMPELSDIKLDQKVKTVFSPDAPHLVLSKIAWKKDDELKLDEFGQVVSTPGDDMPFPFVYAPFENRSKYWHDSRGGALLCVDEQIASTQLQNVKATLLDYYAQPLLKGDRDIRNSSNVTFQPGSYIGSMEWQNPPQIPAAVSFEQNSLEARASKRMGVGSQQSFSENMSESRKVQKTKAEIDAGQAQSAIVSSASVDRFSDPLSDLFGMVWDDVVAEGLIFPLMSPGSGGFEGQVDPAIYTTPMMMVPASSSRTLDPERQRNLQMQLVQFLTPYVQMGVPIDLNEILQDVVRNGDPALVSRYFIDPNAAGPQGQPPIYQMIEQLNQMLQQVAQGGKMLEEEVNLTQQLAVENSDRIEEEHERNAIAQ